MTPGQETDGGGDDLVGTLLAGRYRILRKLGEGAMGSVYLGEHLRIGRCDAIKVLRPTLDGDSAAMARFERGARNASSIHHPNVCTVYDFGDAERGRRFLSMEYVPGEPLQDLLRREGALSPARSVAIAARVAEGLQAAHDRGIVHRDLKPGNVMISPARGDAVKVVDFDIAKGSTEGVAEDVTQMGFVIGTPKYMSPEQLLGLPLDGRSDVYALALMLFEMLTGHPPGGARDTQQCVVQRMSGKRLPLEDGFESRGTPPALREVVARALQPRAEDRFPSAAAFARAITQALEEPVLAAASPPVPWAPLPEPHTRGGVPPTRLVAGGPAPETPRRFHGQWFAVAVAALLAAGTAWVIARPLRPPPTAGRETAAASPLESPGPAVTHSVAPIPSARVIPAPPAKPAQATTSDEERRTVTYRGVALPSSVDAEQAELTAPLPLPAAEPEAGTVLEGLEDRVGPPYPAAAELRRVRDAAREIWERGDRLDVGPRARAAFVLAHAELALGDVEGCVRWAERAATLRPGGARQVLLDECRRVRG